MAIWNPFRRQDEDAAGAAEGAASGDEKSTEQSGDETRARDSEADAPPAANVSQDATDGSAAAEAETMVPESRSLMKRFRTALKKTVNVLNTDIRDLVGKDGRLVDDEFLMELYAHLIKTDMGSGPAKEIRDQIGSTYRGRKVHMTDLLSSAKETITELMQQPEAPIQMAESGPTIVMVVGVNGSGKTTSIAKLANLFHKQGQKVVLGAGDTFRAAAVEQLTIWADRTGAEIVKTKQGGEPASVAYQAVERAAASNADICIVDTAGRLQTQSHLMDELTKIRRVCSKVIPEAPHEVLLVLDATAGQNAISQARGFSEAAGCTGIVLAKLDGTAKGGVAIPIRREFDLPVKYIGLGEKEDDIALFNVDQYVEALFDIDGDD